MARTPGTSSPTPAPPGNSPEAAPADAHGYTVIARRYRPQRFEDVVGQDGVVQSLRNAIRMDRLSHAYLFAGTRGVGKTSIARIFAKCLNCVHGPTDEPCNECDICQAISVGEDVDVIEIDGASNNGVDSVRELRQNAGLRPSRSRFKIYYIDEVHMLSTGAFNALLKTLEEPPEHVKFLFATTEPNKIPITVLSRCLRYDFAGIPPDQVVASLAEICRREGVTAEPEALQVVARRAAGSMRDAQSLLEQLLSAGGEALTVEAVHQRLGAASDERLLDLIDALADHDATAVLTQVETASRAGVQPADLLNGLIEYLRDLMVLSVGGESVLLAATPRQKPRLAAVVGRWPLDTVLAALQIVAEARGKLRGSPHGRIVAEMALLKVARLEDLDELGRLVARLAALESGAPPAVTSAPALKKKAEPLAGSMTPGPTGPPPSPRPAPPRDTDGDTDGPPVTPPPVVPPTSRSQAVAASSEPALPPLTVAAVREAWGPLLKKVGAGLSFSLVAYQERLAAHVAISGPNTLVMGVPPGYNHIAERCDTPEARARIEHALTALLRRPVSVRIERTADGATAEPGPADVSETRRRDQSAVDDDPMVRKVVELFEARRLHLDYDDDAAHPPSP